MHLTYDASGHIGLDCSVTVVPAPRVRVNEVQTGTSISAADEFIEISNTGTAAADIGGWKIVYRSATGTSDTTLVTIPAGTTLPTGGFYLATGSAYAGLASADSTFSPGLAASGGGVGLRDAVGALVDSIGWGTATNVLVEGAAAAAPPATAAPGSSLIRHPDGNDTNANAADLIVTTSATPRHGNG